MTAVESMPSVLTCLWYLAGGVGILALLALPLGAYIGGKVKR